MTRAPTYPEPTREPPAGLLEKISPRAAATVDRLLRGPRAGIALLVVAAEGRAAELAALARARGWRAHLRAPSVMRVEMPVADFDDRLVPEAHLFAYVDTSARFAGRDVRTPETRAQVLIEAPAERTAELTRLGARVRGEQEGLLAAEVRGDRFAALLAEPFVASVEVLAVDPPDQTAERVDEPLGPAASAADDASAADAADPESIEQGDPHVR